MAGPSVPSSFQCGLSRAYIGRRITKDRLALCALKRLVVRVILEELQGTMSDGS